MVIETTVRVDRAYRDTFFDAGDAARERVRTRKIDTLIKARTWDQYWQVCREYCAAMRAFRRDKPAGSTGHH